MKLINLCLRFCLVIISLQFFETTLINFEKSFDYNLINNPFRHIQQQNNNLEFGKYNIILIH